MNFMGVKRLEIAGFKSIDNVELTDLPNYCVFAGANGAGKSNFFDALKFAATVIDDGAVKAIRQFHGFERIHCVKRRKVRARTFRFVCDVGLPKASANYSLVVHHMDKTPELKENLTIQTDKSVGSFVRDCEKLEIHSGDEKKQIRLPKEYSLLGQRFFLPAKQSIHLLRVFFPYVVQRFSGFSL